MAVKKGPRVTKTDKPKQRQKKEEDVGERGTPKSATNHDGDVSGKGSGIGGVKGNAGAPEADLCADCGKAVQTMQQGLQCDGCGFWHHATCEKVANDVYNFLENHDDSSLLWYCKKCVVTCKKMTAVVTTMHEHQQHLEDKVNELTSTFNQKLDDLARSIQVNLDTKVLEQKSAGDESQRRVEEKFDALIDSMKQTIDTKALEQKSAGDEGQRRVEEKFDALIDSMKQKIDVPSVVGDAISNRLKEDQDEMEEIRRRRTNVIIHSLKESTDPSAEQRVKDDENLVQDLMHQIDCDTVSATAWIRLGKRQDDPVANPRSMLLVLASEEQKEMVLKQAKNLRDRKTNGWDKIYIHQDRTPRQRQRRQQLVQQMRQRQVAGEKNLIIVNDRIVIRRTRLD